MGETKFVVGMRDAFFDALYPVFQSDRNCVFVTADYGAPSLDRFAEELPDQYYTVGIAEQQLIGMACGMALEGRKVYTYAAAAFLAHDNGAAFFYEPQHFVAPQAVSQTGP